MYLHLFLLLLHVWVLHIKDIAWMCWLLIVHGVRTVTWLVPAGQFNTGWAARAPQSESSGCWGKCSVNTRNIRDGDLGLGESGADVGGVPGVRAAGGGRGSWLLSGASLQSWAWECGLAWGLPSLGPLLLWVWLLSDQVRCQLWPGKHSFEWNVQGNLGGWDTVPWLQWGEQWTGAASEDAAGRAGGEECGQGGGRGWSAGSWRFGKIVKELERQLSFRNLTWGTCRSSWRNWKGGTRQYFWWLQ